MPTMASSTSAGEPLRITRLELRNWRNFAQVDVPLARRVFLVGPNASGKSNLLDSIRFLKDLVEVGGGLQAAIRARGGVSAIRSLSARRQPEVAISVRVGTTSEPDRWEYTLSFSQGTGRTPTIKRETVARNRVVLLDRPLKEDRDDEARLGQTHLEQVNVNREFREVVEFLQGVRYLHIVPQLIRDPERYIGRPNDPYGGDFLEQVARTPRRTQQARLSQIVRALKVAVPQLETLKLEQDAKGRWHLQGKYVHWRPQGAWQSEAQFSDGTLRLAGLLWSLLDGQGPLLLEEPELSVHPGVVRYIPQLIARTQRKTQRQILISTHSPDLLRDEGIGLDEVLLLEPGAEGTTVRPASDIRDVRVLLEGGVSIADAVMPRTEPEHAEQLALSL
jgi:predicted ATPase